MNRNEVRQELFSYFKRNRETQIRSIQNHFSNVLGSPIQPHEHIDILETIQELINSGVLMVGVNWDNWRYPWLRVTEYGMECIEAENLLPFDPEGYTREMKEQIPDLDNVTEAYLSEGVTTYNRNCLLSSTICLGVASEQVILNLTDALVEAIGDPQEKADFKRRIEGRFIYGKHKALREKIEDKKTQLPAKITENLDVYLDAIFNFIRLNRNEAGHPTGATVSKKTVCANLQVFSDYAERVYALISWLRDNQI